MDMTALAKALTAFLIPVLPYLLDLGDKAAKEAASKLGAEVWERAKDLWLGLHPQVAEQPDAQKAVQSVAAALDDEKARSELEAQLRQLINENPILAKQVAATLKDPHIRAYLKLDEVLAGGEATGIEADIIEEGQVETNIEVKKVAGKVKGILVNRIGGKSEP